MLKPTSELLAEIITFVLNDQQVRKSLAARDNDQYTRADGISCRFFKYNTQDDKRSAYLVNFVYLTKYQQDERNDDVEILVEVIEGTPNQFAIRNVRFY